MEFVLRENAYAFEPSVSYKTMMDKMIDKMIDNHHTGKTNYTSSWEEVRKELF